VPWGGRGKKKNIEKKQSGSGNTHRSYEAAGEIKMLRNKHRMPKPKIKGARARNLGKAKILPPGVRKDGVRFLGNGEDITAGTDSI